VSTGRCCRIAAILEKFSFFDEGKRPQIALTYVGDKYWRHSVEACHPSLNVSQEKGMSYTGTVLKDLQAIVKACLQRDSRICAVCRQLFGEHSVIGAHCPDPALPGPAYVHTGFQNFARQMPHPAREPVAQGGH